jgi:RNA polymerase sigma-70 factor (ECF subfamily)
LGEALLRNSLLREARDGSSVRLGELWETCRSYLLLVAGRELPGDLRQKVAPSDIVQETFLKAQRDLIQFRGETHAELVSWLRRILLNEIYGANRRFHGTKKRLPTKEVGLNAHGDSQAGVDVALDTKGPASRAAANEQEAHILAAMDRLPVDYRAVLQFRYWQRLSMEEIGRRMGRTSEAVRKLWTRALARLEQELGAEDGESTTR